MMHGFGADPELRCQTCPHAGSAEDDLDERDGVMRDLRRRGEGVEEVHPRLAKAFRNDPAEAFVHAADEGAEEVEAEDEEPEDDENRGGTDRAEADDLQPA